MSTDAYRRIIAAPPRDRLGLFLATANRIGAPVGHVEKDFWVCWTLNSLYQERPAGEPRLLFKGGTLQAWRRRWGGDGVPRGAEVVKLHDNS